MDKKQNIKHQLQLNDIHNLKRMKHHTQISDNTKIIKIELHMHCTFRETHLELIL